jgi:hypothetical protein
MTQTEDDEEFGTDFDDFDTCKPYSFLAIPRGPKKGLWMRFSVWQALGNGDILDASEDAVKLCWEHGWDHLLGKDREGDPKVNFKVCHNDRDWDVLVALAAMGEGKHFAYDPAKDEEVGE